MKEKCQKGTKIGNPIEIQYCADVLKRINKCCKVGENINLRGKSCTDHMAEKNFHDEFPQATGGIFDHYIIGMKKEYLAIVAFNATELNEDLTTLTYQGIQYKKENFCIDYLNDYCCQEEVRPVLSAIIHDKTLAQSKTSGSIYYGAEDTAAPKIMLLKRIGYSISLFFLFLTLAIHIVDPILMKVVNNFHVIIIKKPNPFFNILGT